MTSQLSSENQSAADEELEQTWIKLNDPSHFEHEDIIHFLEFNPDPRSVPRIRDAINLKPQLKYLDYDDYGAYYKKCLWALQKIGTPEAVQLIKDCAESEITALRDQARYRLEKI
jgi:hypothetical protein